MAERSETPERAAGDASRSSSDTPSATPSYDAVLVMSFGGPEGPDDVLPFLQRVTAGRNIPPERLEEVGEHYYAFDGKSPINDQNRALIAALEEELAEHDIDLPIYFGNRNWHPLVTDTLREMADDGVERALMFVTATWSSYSSCRQYREDIERAQQSLADEGVRPPAVDKIRHFYNHPGFIGTQVDRLRAALDEIPPERRPDARIVFTAHSIPHSMARTGRYEPQLHEAARLVLERLPDRTAAATGGNADYDLVYQSRSGPPHVPWLEPDICDHLEALHAGGVADVVVVPLGFLSDHMEVVYDLDTEAAEVADELGLNMVRAATPGTHPQFVSMIRELIQERIDPMTKRRALGAHGPSWDVCPVGCCAYTPRGRPRRSSGDAAADTGDGKRR